jgi:hypothetical protein
MQGRISANAGRQRRTGCAAAACGAPTKYGTHGERLVFEVTTVSAAGFKERWQVRDYGHEVRVEPLPELGKGVRVGLAYQLKDEYGHPRRPAYGTARDLALQVMEAAGLLEHEPDAEHTHHLRQVHA